MNSNIIGNILFASDDIAEGGDMKKPTHYGVGFLHWNSGRSGLQVRVTFFSLQTPDFGYAGGNVAGFRSDSSGINLVAHQGVVADAEINAFFLETGHLGLVEIAFFIPGVVEQKIDALAVSDH